MSDIPKIVHYIWLGKNKMSPSVKRCINSWRKKLPDYQFMLWNEDSYDINKCPWTKEAYESGKYAFVSDYIRLDVLNEYGGIYFDTDVMLYKNLDSILNHSFVSAVEYHPGLLEKFPNQIDENGCPVDIEKGVCGVGILTAFLASVAGGDFVNKCLKFYDDRHFINKDGTLALDLVNTGVMPRLLESYGFVYKNEKQLLKNDIFLFDAYSMIGDLTYKNHDCYLIHWCDQSWVDEKTGSLKTKLGNFLRVNIPFIFRRRG